MPTKKSTQNADAPETATDGSPVAFASPGVIPLQLACKLNPAFVKGRKQGGREVSYIEGWHAIAEANRIFGFLAWDRTVIDMKCVAEQPRKIGKDNPRDGWGVSYVASVRITISIGDHTLVREGTGAGHGIDVDLGQAHESAVKEAETDAMKRALSTFGNPFGLALYDKQRANVGVEIDTTPPEYVSDEEARAIVSGIDAAGIDRAKFLDWAKADDETSILKANFGKVMSVINERLARTGENDASD